MGTNIFTYLCPIKVKVYKELSPHFITNFLSQYWIKQLTHLFYQSVPYHSHWFHFHSFSQNREWQLNLHYLKFHFLSFKIKTLTILTSETTRTHKKFEQSKETFCSFVLFLSSAVVDRLILGNVKSWIFIIRKKDYYVNSKFKIASYFTTTQLFIKFSSTSCYSVD